MWAYNYSNELYHHGVKGMRWGVWNSDTRQRYASSSNTQHLGKKYATVKGSNKYGHVGKKQGVYIQKGSELARMTGTEREKTTNGSAYYAIIKQDADKYKRINLGKQLIAEATGKNINEWGGRYQSRSLLKEDLVAPTKKEARQILGKTLKTKDAQKAMLNAMNNQAEGRGHHQSSHKIRQTERQIKIASKTGVASNELLNRLSNVSGEGRNAAIKEVNKSQGLKTSSIRDDFYKNLNKKGYNAILDYNDMGKVSKAPIIVLNKQQTVYVAAGEDIVKQYHSRRINEII